jgi:hypothetical protein
VKRCLIEVTRPTASSGVRDALARTHFRVERFVEHSKSLVPPPRFDARSYVLSLADVVMFNSLQIRKPRSRCGTDPHQQRLQSTEVASRRISQERKKPPALREHSNRLTAAKPIVKLGWMLRPLDRPPGGMDRQALDRRRHVSPGIPANPESSALRRGRHGPGQRKQPLI